MTTHTDQPDTFSERPTYRERREAKADRLREWADKRQVKATTDLTRAGVMADAIPLGQPILVGHHSERRDRNYRDRIGNTMSRGMEHQRKAEDFERRADGIAGQLERSIYSDDVDAVEKLTERIAELEAERDRIKAYNASCRKGARDVSLLDEAQQASLASVARHSSYNLGKHGEMPGYALTNLSGNINRNKKRLAEMER